MMPELSYNISLSCADDISIHDVAVRNTCGLSLARGSVTDAVTLSDLTQYAEILLPPCASITDKKINVGLDYGSGYSERIYTSTSKKASVEVACAGELITYEVTFTNHSSRRLDRVRIYDEIPPEVTLVPDSVHPKPDRGESLPSGITMGCLDAGQTTMLTYSVTVDYGSEGCIANCAYAEYCYLDYRGCCHYGMGSRQFSFVTIIPKCMYRCIQVRLPVCDFSCSDKCYIYHTNAMYLDFYSNPFVSAGYGIAVKYVDSNGETKTICHESSMIFGGLPCDFNPGHFTVRYDNLSFRCDNNGCVIAEFTAILEYYA